MNKEENLDMILHILTNAKICAEYLVKDFFQTKMDINKIPAIGALNKDILKIENRYNKKFKSLNKKIGKIGAQISLIDKLVPNNANRLISKEKDKIKVLNNLKKELHQKANSEINICKENYLIVDNKDRSVFEAYNEYCKLNLEIDEIIEMKEFLKRGPYYAFQGSKKFAEKIYSTVESFDEYKGNYKLEIIDPKSDNIYKDKIKLSPLYNEHNIGYALRNINNNNILFIGSSNLTVSKKDFDNIIKQLNKFVGKEVGDEITNYVYNLTFEMFNNHKVNYGHHHSGQKLIEDISQ